MMILVLIINFLKSQIKDLYIHCMNLATETVARKAMIYGLHIDPHNDQLPVGLISQMVEYCAGISDVRL